MANKRLSAVITIGGAVAGSLGAAFGAVTGNTQRLGTAVADLTRKQKLLSQSIQVFGRQGKDVDGLRLKYAAVTRELEKQQTILARLQRIETAREHNLHRRHKIMMSMMDTTMFAGSILFPAGAAVKRSSEFNYQLQAIANTGELSRAATIGLGAEILRISDETAKSTQDVQRAMGYLVAAGMDVGLAARVLRPVGRTATATASEIEDVAKATFTLNDALKIQPQGMQRALDMLVQAGKEGNFEFKDMAAELPVLAAGMQALKMTGGEAVATLGAALQIARKGAGSSQQAATNVENFLAKVMSPETLKKAQKNFGVDLYKIISTAQKNGQNPFEAAVLAINKMTKGGDQKLLGELFQDMQVQNFLRPMLQNLAEYQRIKARALSAEGVTDTDFAKMMATTKVQTDQAASAVGRLAIAVGNALAPAIGAVLSVFTPMVRTITSFVEQNPNVVAGALMLTGGMLALRIGTLAAGFAWTFAKGAVLAMLPVLTRAVPVVRLVGSALLFAGKAVLWLGRALLMNPIGLAITAIAGAAYLIYKNWEPLKTFFTGLWDSIGASFRTFYDWIVGKAVKVAQFFGFNAGTSASSAGENAAPALPAVPPVASRGNTTVMDNSQTTIQVVQQPGQDAKALADEIERRRRQQAGVRARSSMLDPVGAW